MSTTQNVHLGGVHVRGPWNSADDVPVQAELAVYTKAGQARIVVLEERELLRLAHECIEALGMLRIRRTHLAGQLDPPRRDDSARAMLDEEPRGSAESWSH